ncbi:helix-turn-helix transcriptional regulator [Geodermatophilus ruber]|uniref:DNA-binding transcriptional regulator, CsgD family n=1 Tax=Geodermatophilus ruber TaxID=504800 RepID=A0A1I4FXN5_9ACTN|nr:LuxR C-terminal-related transcriptional regulator [Geodermatophilus ruber]SFL21757.1 DNA-binding transcriptional regulator, CsgD family [Geodermatophilus ruber]
MPSDVGARGLPVNAAEILTEVTGIGAAPGTLAERAGALLAQVQRVIPFEAGFIALLPPGGSAHVPLIRHGYDDRTDGYLDSPEFLHDLELGGQRRTRHPVQHVDTPVPQAEIPVWAEYLLPAGFRGAVGVALFTPDHRYLGLLGVTTERATPTGADACNLAELLAEQVAVAVDPWRSLATIAEMVHAATAGVVLTLSGMVQPLPGRPDHRLLARGSGVLAAAVVQLAEGSTYASFLAPLPGGEDGDDAGTHARITVLAAPPDLQLFAAAVVLVSPAGNLHGLSRRELQVLGLLVTGATNEQIAEGLGISVRTVAVHLDHVRAKLGAPSRTTAAARALRLGLFVPSPL